MPERTPVALFRAFVPRWSHQPLSGEGASRFGGRWNPIGSPAIYAARELSTAWAEYSQGFIQHPAMIAKLLLSNADLADLTEDATLNRLGVDADIHRCEWRAEMEAGKVPATHHLRQLLITDGRDGVVYPSFMSPGGTCIALWRWNVPDAPKLTVVDPDERLPKTAASWV